MDSLENKRSNHFFLFKRILSTGIKKAQPKGWGVLVIVK